MGFVDIQATSDVGGYPLLSSISGAATRWQALSDSSDTTFVYQETANAVDGLDIIKFATPSIPAGAIVTGAELHARGAHFYPNAVTGFGVQGFPKTAYQRPYAPDPYAIASTPLGSSAGAWYFAYPAVSGTAYDFVVSYNPTFQYNNGMFAFDYLTWNQIDLTSLRLLIGWHTPASGAGTNRLYKCWLRIFYNQPPTISGVQPSDLSGGQTFTTTPTITWTYSDTDGDVQTQHRVIVVPTNARDNLGNPAGATNFNPEKASITSFDSGVMPMSQNRMQVGPKGLTNLSNYYAYVKVWHTPIQGNEMASSWVGSASFQVNGTAPSAPQCNCSSDSTNARNLIEVIQGSWSSTPYPSYFDVYKVINNLTGATEPVRGGIHASAMTGMRTGSTAANNIQTPDVTALHLTGNLEIRACVAFEATPAGDYIMTKADTPNGVSWNFRVMSTGKLQFEYTNAGLQTALSPSAIPLPAVKTPIWIRVVYTSTSNWNAIFYYSFDDPSTNSDLVNWTGLGTFTGSGAGPITSTVAPLNINGTPTINQSTFRVYYAELRNSSGTVVANPDFRGAQIGSTTITDSTGKVWTINRAGANQNFAFLQLYDYEDTPNTFRFYLAGAVTLSAGSAVSSALTTGGTAGYSMSVPYTWYFKVVLTPNLNDTFSIVEDSWDSHRPSDAAAYSALGRPYKVVVSDGAKGNEQTLVVECLNIGDYNGIKAIYEAAQVVLVQSAGDQRYFCFTDWKDKRGTLANGYSLVSLTAVEVDKPMIA